MTHYPRIDVHSHYVPEFYREALIAAGHSEPDGIRFIPDWSEEAALAAMDKIGVRKAYLSISSPGVYFGDAAAAATLARRVNEEGARLANEHPERFAFFASTPLPDIEATLTEIAYAFDELGAAGVVFETNFDGLYLGDDRLAPVYAELNRRRAVIFLHPTSPAAPCGGWESALPYPRPMMEFMFETTRSVTDMVLSGTLDRYPDIEMIVPHAGATLPLLASRIDVIGGRIAQQEEPMHKALKRLHFDLAGMPLPDMLRALLEVTEQSHIHYGSDMPFTPFFEVERHAAALDETALLDAASRSGIMAANTEALFDRR